MIRRFLGTILFLLVSLSNPAFSQIVGDMVDAPVAVGTQVRSEVGKRFTVHATTDPIFQDFTGLAVQVASLSTELTMDIRTSEGEMWTEWMPLHVVPSATGGTFVGGMYGDRVFSSTEIDLRIEGDVAYGVEILSLGVFDNRIDEDRKLPEPAPVRSLVGKQTGLIIPPTLINRSQWNAEPFRGTPVNLARPTYDFMTFHHAAGYSATTVEEGIAQVYAIQDLHQNVRGWSDIGYQFLIDRGGHLYQGRPFMDGSTSLAQVPVLAMGAHVGEANTGNIGVSILGCYHPPEGSYCEDEITPEALSTYQTLFAFLSERYGVEPTMIRGHRDFSATSCPGNNNYVLLPELITDVEQLLITGNESLGSASMVSSTDDEGVIHIEWETLENIGIVGYRIERRYRGSNEYIYDGSDFAGSVSDGTIGEEGTVVYNLNGVSADGREQRMDTIELDVEFPDSYVVSQVYPNPVQSTARFRYKLKHDGIVNISVYDLSGRAIQSRSEGYKSGGRFYDSTLDVSSYPSGVYYYRVLVEGFSDVDFDGSKSFVVIR